MVLGELIARERRRRGIQQKELARIVEVKQQHISMIEHGKVKEPKRELLEKIATALNIDMSVFHYALGARHRPVKDPESVIEELRMMLPIRVPVLVDYRSGILNGNIRNYLYLNRDLANEMIPQHLNHRLFALYMDTIDMSQCDDKSITKDFLLYFADGLEPKMGNTLLCEKDGHVFLKTYYFDKELEGIKVCGVAIRGAKNFI